MAIEKVNIVGMGALGLLFGTAMAKSKGVSVSYVMDEDRLERHKKDVYTVNGEIVHPCMISKEEAKKRGPADFVLLSVKFPGLDSALNTMGTSVGENTILLSVMNGIDSPGMLADRFGEEKVLYSVAQGMDAQRYGSSLKFSVRGQLNIGVPKDSAYKEVLEKKLDEVCAFFDSVGIVYVREKDIVRRMWSKLMLNVGINQVCMVYNISYGEALKEGSEAFAMVVAAMREVCVVARQKGIDIGENDIAEYITILKTLSPAARPSMGQDRLEKRQSEVEMFAGTINRLGKELQIVTPVNEYLYRRVKEIEAEY